jgi:N-methylhydantoinase B/oxoprolinase/acetone carboxylase alpha subunit
VSPRRRQIPSFELRRLVPLALLTLCAVLLAACSGKELVDVEAGDVISVRTPGAGGWGAPEGEKSC